MRPSHYEKRFKPLYDHIRKNGLIQALEVVPYRDKFIVVHGLARYFCIERLSRFAVHDFVRHFGSGIWCLVRELPIELHRMIEPDAQILAGHATTVEYVTQSRPLTVEQLSRVVRSLRERGYTKPQIAVIINRTPRTVQKYLNP